MLTRRLTRRLGLGLAVVAAANIVACRDDPVTVYVVRHAEKAATPEDDPPLSPVGQARAAALPETLARLPGAGPLTAVFSSPFARTRQTVAPVADRYDLPILTVGAGDIDGVVASLRRLAPGQRALVAGHSNTVPRILAALGIRGEITLSEEAYGDLFVVTLTSPPTLERRTF
ncbi:MAG: phosphoglycerate mutase family protein [Myxococcota bacterium]